MLGRLWQLLKRELRVALETFLAAWVLLTVALQLWCLFDSPKLHGAGDVLLLLTVGGVICAFYTFWPACIVTACRVVYRVLGWGAYVGALLGALGIVVMLVLWRHLFGGLLVEVFTGAGPMGPCGGHAGGPAAVLALLCLLGAIVTSPASLWALAKLFLAVGAAVLLGSLPGTLLWLALLLRKVAKLASAGVSR
ncbi:MAG: hypothetical protein ABUL60_35740 [Myxococcales bacterium]